jgi:hypothetical protein
MSITDKILISLEEFCYLMLIGDIMAIIFAIKEKAGTETILLLIAFLGIIKCALESRSSRELHIGIFKSKKYELKYN